LRGHLLYRFDIRKKSMTIILPIVIE
jgi:hypothetical protein